MLGIAIADAEVRSSVMAQCMPYDINIIEEGAAYQLMQSDNEFLLMRGDETLWRCDMPVRLHTLIQQIVAYLSDAEPIMIGHYTLNQAQRILSYDNQGAVDLTEKETELLAYLHEHLERGVEKAALIERVWGYHPDAETRTVDTHLYRLRQKIELLPKKALQIVALQGRYYIKTD